MSGAFLGDDAADLARSSGEETASPRHNFDFHTGRQPEERPLGPPELPRPVWKSKFYGAFVLNHRVDLHAIDATPARWRGDVGSSPLDGLISTQALAAAVHLVLDLGLHRAEVAVPRFQELGRQAEVLWVYRRSTQISMPK